MVFGREDLDYCGYLDPLGYSLRPGSRSPGQNSSDFKVAGDKNPPKQGAQKHLQPPMLLMTEVLRDTKYTTPRHIGSMQDLCPRPCSMACSTPTERLNF